MFWLVMQIILCLPPRLGLYLAALKILFHFIHFIKLGK